MAGCQSPRLWLAVTTYNNQGFQMLIWTKWEYFCCSNESQITFHQNKIVHNVPNSSGISSVRVSTAMNGYQIGISGSVAQGLIPDIRQKIRSYTRYPAGYRIATRFGQPLLLTRNRSIKEYLRLLLTHPVLCVHYVVSYFCRPTNIKNWTQYI